MEFLECHAKDTCLKILIPLHKIFSISECENSTAFIEINIDSDGGIGVFTKESYKQIKEQINKNIFGEHYE